MHRTDFDKDELLAAIVDNPQPGQRVVPVRFRLPYARQPSVQYIDLSLLPAKTAAALQSAHSSASRANTTAVSSVFKKLTAIARADAGTEQPDFQAGVTALLNRSKSLLLTQAWLNKPDGVARAQGAINALQALQGNAAQMAANKDAASEGGYSVCAIFQAAWPALPIDIEYLSMAQVQDFLALHGVKLAADTVANTNIDGVGQLQDHIVTAVDVDDKHDVARADVGDGAGCHGGSFVMGVDVQRDGIITRVYAA